MRYILKRIGIGSAFKVGFIVGVMLSALVFLPLGLLMASGVLGGEGRMTDLAATSAVSSVLIMFCGPIVYGIVYGIGAALSALVYNIVSGIVGGLELQLSARGQSWGERSWGA